jgi:8-oxo-dGTP diphosphatase
LISVHVVAGILQREGLLLVAQRPAGKPYSGYWEFPGGKVEKHEASEHALKRELHEELGIEVISPQHLFDHKHAYPDKNVLLEIWLVSQFSGEPQSKENQELRWVSFSEMIKLKLLEGNLSIVENLAPLFIV